METTEFRSSLTFHDPSFNFQANAALMFDAMSVLTEAFSRMLRKKPDLFRGTNGGGNGNVGTGSSASSSASASATLSGSVFGFGGNGRPNGSREVHCGTGPDFMDSVIPFELGEKIAKHIRKVRTFFLAHSPGLGFTIIFSFLFTRTFRGLLIWNLLAISLKRANIMCRHCFWWIIWYGV